MKKICLASWNNAENFGTNLQTYALAQVLKMQNHDVYLLNYYRNLNWLNLKDVIQKIGVVLRSRKDRLINRIKMRYFAAAFSKELEIRFQRIHKFTEQNFNSTHIKAKSQYHDLCEKMDIFISGSDQVWNPKYLNYCFMLDFVDNNKPKIAYAASFGVESLPKHLRQKFIKLLGSYSRISVREASGMNIIKDLLKREVKVVLDPTLLLSEKMWHEFALKAQIPSNKIYRNDYILCYFVGDKPEYWEYVDALESQLGLPVIVLPICPNTYKRNKEMFTTAGPYEFTWMIEHAAFVCTDSFHATAFSITFKKNFCVLKRFSDNDKSSQNSRLYGFLSELDLEKRIILNIDSISKISKDIPNYEKIHEKLVEMRNYSFDYLAEALESR